MRSTIKRFTLILAAGCGCFGSSIAPVAAAPLSWQGQPGSTYQQWRFDTDANPCTAEVVSNLSAGGEATIAPGDFAMGWNSQLPGMAGANGCWDLGRSGTITLPLPAAFATPTAEVQHLLVQVLQWRDAGIYRDPATVFVPGATAVAANRQTVALASVGGWVLEQSEWDVSAGATADHVLVSGAANGTIVDSVSVETSRGGIVSRPVLHIREVAGTNLTECSWSAPSNSFILESTTALTDTATWQAVDAPVEIVGDLHRVAVETTQAVRFFRLKQQ